MSRVVAMGECMLELAPSGFKESSNTQFGYGGDTLNTAIYMARLGAQVEYATALGDDPYSQKMAADWQREGVGITLVRHIAKRLPGLYLIETDYTGERRFFYWREQSAAREYLNIFTDDELFDQLSVFDYIYLTGITLSLYDDNTLSKLWLVIERYRALGNKVVFDPNYRPSGWESSTRAQRIISRMLELTDIALPSFSDEQLLYADKQIDTCINRYQRAGVTELVVKLGEQGCVVVCNNIRVSLHTQKVCALDTTAAGDSFNAAYLAARGNGLTPIQAAKLGQRCAAFVIQHRGAIVDREKWPATLTRQL
jgi:2-dehydro-3-deoxygluconokinase